VAPIEWKTRRLPKPRERVREATADQEAQLVDGLEDGCEAAVCLAIQLGCRMVESVGLTWQRVDLFSRHFTVIGKGDTPRTLPMSNAIFKLLWDETDHHATGVFTKRRFCVSGDRAL